ncbi:MAG: FtsX-like permease family protein [Deltaproteobacteria bacterium]|nr:FtsX-like permease family protein [Deltaproteobacteria bacterium]
MRYELQIAARYLRARRRDAFISITTIFTAIGVMIGVAALVVVLAVMGGFEQSLRQRILTLTPQVQILSFNGSISNYDDLLKRADSLRGVAGSDPFIVGQAMMSSPRGISGVIVRGIDPQNAAIVSQLLHYIQHGSLDTLSVPAAVPVVATPPPVAKLSKSASRKSHAPPPTPAPVVQAASTSSPPSDGAIAIGSTLAEKLKVAIGDPVTAVVPVTAGPDNDIATKTGHFKVGAIFESGVAFLDRDLVFMGLGNAQSFFGRVGKVDGLEVQLINLDDTDLVTAQLRKQFGTSYRVTNWMQFNEAAAAGFEMLKRVYALVLLMLIGVAAFNLVATLIMVVMEKRKDIAVLMSMGATPREVRLIFVLKGLIVGAFGTVAGLMLGAIGCFVLSHYHFIHIQKEIYGMSTVPIQFQPFNFLLVAVASMILCLVATFYPARQASRELPVEVFRS